MPSGLVQATSLADGVRLITFNRPEKRNALSCELLDDFLAELGGASTDPAVKAIVISGNGTFFSGKPHRRVGIVCSSPVSLAGLHSATLGSRDVCV
jgi:1,4-dihydroxy-2-naphthoyl-CoA synthase